MNSSRNLLWFAFAVFILLGPSDNTHAQNAFSRGPFLQNATAGSIHVIWRTTNAASTRVQYGLTPAMDMESTDPVPVTNHVVTLAGLEPATTYYYQAWSENGDGALASAPATFRTLKNSGSISFEVVGDTAGASAVTSNLVFRMLDGNPDLVVHLGDIANGTSGTYMTEAYYSTQFFNVFQPQIRTTPYYLICGNHDTDIQFGGDLGTNFQKAFYLPTNSAEGTKLYYSFDHGDVHFVCLYEPWFKVYQLTNGSTQYSWLTNDLAASTKPWKLMFTHFPVAASGQHAGDDYNANHVWDQYELMNVLAPVAQQFGVQMMFSGHDHAFERYAPTNGLHYVVNGDGGQPMYNFQTMHFACEQFWPAYAFLRVNITNDTLTLQAIGTNGVAFDSMTVQKGLPPRQLYQAAWHTVSMAAGPANDSDGNITNQWFDFAGSPLLPRAGQFSNLGEVYVNNDGATLFIGLKHAMIYPNNNIFLFIDSPVLGGVATMAGLGNGIIDPKGQGADGLDCLENLSFTNFTPAIGCILGDEYADGQFRSFTRSNLSLNIGQGVYRLEPALSDVAGSFVQQFNRSPQSGLVTGNGINKEQNADFITVAIPLSALGGVEPGDIVRLGAVVGGPGYDAVAQTRQLDTSALAVSLSGSGQGSVVLEGVGVQLALDPAVPPLRITLAILNSEQCQLSWNAEVGKTYEIQYSEDLIHFHAMDSRIAASTIETYIVPFDPVTGGFYRIKRLR